MTRVDTVWTHARLATMPGGPDGLGVVEDGVLAARDGRIAWCGPRGEAPSFETATTVDCEGRWITPGLVDCHTHLVFGGHRIDEFKLRLAGARYEDMAAIGGIRSTVAQTRAADAATLAAQSLRRLDALMAEGVTTVEIKSGYGIDAETEIKQLMVARGLGDTRAIRVVPTYLGLHAFDGSSADAHVAYACDEVLPRIAAAGLAAAVDAFCERIAFSAAQTEQFFEAAQMLGLRIKLHADQLSDGDGAALAARFGALSADHLEYASDSGVRAMAAAGTVAVLLPGAFFTLRETQPPPVAALRRHRVPIAIATDLNPGTSPVVSPLLTMRLAATCFGLTVEECLLGMTVNAARALDLHHKVGTLSRGKTCDLAIWDIEQPAELVYWLGANPLTSRVFAGS